MSKFYYYKSLLILTSILTLFTHIISCSPPPKEINKSEIKKAIQEVEKSLSEDDFTRWNANVTTTDLNKYFKVLTFYVCMLDKKNPEKSLVILTPVSMEATSDAVKVDIAIEYNGTINALYFEKLKSVAKKALQYGMPSEVTCKFQYVDNKYKLSKMSFSVAYEALFVTQGMF